MLRLDSDWIRPVTVTLTNATVSSSEVIGSPCHVTKIIDEQTVHLIAPMKHEPKGAGAGGGVGNAVIDLGSSCHDTGTGDLGPESTVVDLGLGTESGGLDPGRAAADSRCSDTDTASSVGDTGTKDRDPVRVHSLHGPVNDTRVSGTDVCESAGQISVGDSGNKICDSKRNVLDPGSIVCDLGNGVHGSENVPTDAIWSVNDLGSSASGSGVHDRESLESDPGNAAHVQGCDLGGYNIINLLSTSQTYII